MEDDVLDEITVELKLAPDYTLNAVFPRSMMERAQKAAGHRKTSSELKPGNNFAEKIEGAENSGEDRQR